ncbi:hypothetical protein DBR45_03425 [Pseudomonas sp. HMWF031]|jgi:hypothetical protein|nr:hypothetical protein DBR45_03425 [Pseudomonas sp. HMWF031]
MQLNRHRWSKKCRDGRFVDKTTIEFMLSAVDDLIAEINILISANARKKSIVTSAVKESPPQL